MCQKSGHFLAKSCFPVDLPQQTCEIQKSHKHRLNRLRIKTLFGSFVINRARMHLTLSSYTKTNLYLLVQKVQASKVPPVFVRLCHLSLAIIAAMLHCLFAKVFCFVRYDSSPIYNTGGSLLAKIYGLVETLSNSRPIFRCFVQYLLSI